KYGNVAAKIASIENANFKFIYIIRHPFARITSHIGHLLAEGFQNKVEIIEEHLAYTEYARQLSFYKEIFGRDSIHILFLEDLQNNPQEQLTNICQFLEIDPNYKFTRINTIRNSKNTLNINPQLRNLYKNPIVKSLGNLVPPEIRQKFYGVASRKKPFSVELSKQDRELIMKRLQPDLIQLEKEYGINFSEKWNLSI
ncbi:MAG: sulfotransferase domain-containing protein, partial [Xenococcaceae cyanobacterium MO_167.B52]|nr:sulfotransferase domain-containing protein [Xenococcaceae cyanobacterium MO_167.B52]